MGINVGATDYNDFKVIIDNLPTKIKVVYYKYISGQGFFAIAVTEDLSSVIGVSQSNLPSSFGTDFPNAISVSTSFTTPGNFNAV